MKEYSILAAPTLNELIDMVNLKLRRGWELQGGICVSSGRMYYQAIYRETRGAL